MQSNAGMYTYVETTLKIVENTLFLVGGKEEKGRFLAILWGPAKLPHKMVLPLQHHATFASEK